MNKKLGIVLDYRAAFFSRTSNAKTLCSLHVDRLCSAFRVLEWDVELIHMVDLCNGELIDMPLIITSSEDQFGLYKRYIESVSLSQKLANIVMVPKYELVVAHHNKILMELIRKSIFPEQAKQMGTVCFGCLEELTYSRVSHGVWPKVFKNSSGAGAQGVFLATDFNSLKSIAMRRSLTFLWPEWVYEVLARIRRKGYVPRSLFRNGFIVQEFFPGLTSDYKVLVYGSRFYIVKRLNRKGDFRASGSGKLVFDGLPESDVEKVLDFSKNCFERIQSPILSLDVALTLDGPVLIEFQAVSFGPKTAEASSAYYEYEDGVWRKIEEACDLEFVFAKAIVDFFEGRLPFDKNSNWSMS